MIEQHKGRRSSRRGRRRSRLDRMYVPAVMSNSLLDIQHKLHLTDHKALIVTLNIAVNRRVVDPGVEGYWKLNSQVLHERDFYTNHREELLYIKEKKQDYDDATEWFEECFKKGMREFLINFSQHRAKGRRNMRALLSYYLQEAGKERDWDRMAYCRSKLRRMQQEDSLGQERKRLAMLQDLKALGGPSQNSISR